MTCSVSAPSPSPVDARVTQSLPPSHLVPLLSSVAVKKKKKRRDRTAMLADSGNSPTTHGYASPVQPQIPSERSRSPSAARSRSRSVPAKHADSFCDEQTLDDMRGAFEQPASPGRSALLGHRADSVPPKSVNVAFIVSYTVKDCLLLGFYCAETI